MKKTLALAFAFTLAASAAMAHPHFNKTVTAKLTKGTWRFFCAPHASAMFGRFGVGTAVARASSRPVEPGDDRGREAEPGDDRGGHGEVEPGDDHGGHSGHDG